MLVWPAVAVVGFFALTWVVVALAASSTARYDFARNRVQEAPALDRAVAAPARHARVRSAGRRGDGAARTSRPRKAAARHPSSARLGTGVATHPAGSRLPDAGSATGWWLIDLADGRLVAGPFADRLEAEWAAFAEAPHGWPAARVVHGVRSVTGALLTKPVPEEGAWMLELGQQLTRLGEDWFELVSDTDPLTTLVVEVAEALVEAGLPLHDCSGSSSQGGVCLTPYAESGGIVVSWHGHARMTLQQVHGAAADTALRRTMTAAVADVLAQRGFDVAPLGEGCGHLVTSVPR